MCRTRFYKAGILGGLLSIMTACSASVEPQTPEPKVLPSNHFSEMQIRSDFEALYEGLKSAHVDLYAHQEKETYDTKYFEMLASFDGPQTLLQAQTEFQKFAAFGNVGHARVEFPNRAYGEYRGTGGKAFPIYLRFHDERAFIGENYSGVSSIQAGMELVSINNIPLDEFLRSLEQHISADTRYMAHSLLEFTLPQYIWLEYGELESFELELKKMGGERFEVIVPARTRDDIEQAIESSISAFALQSHERDSKILSGNIGYLRPGPFYDYEAPENPWNNEKFSDFIDEAFQSYLIADVKKLIIDLRLNPGGDSSFSDLMIAWFADEPFSFASEFIVRSSQHAQTSNQARLDTNPGSVEGVSGQYAELYEQTDFGENFNFPVPMGQPRDGQLYTGEVFVLIDRNSYSNAVNVASIVQDYDFGTVIGEKTSDMATTYGAMETFTLPETGISVGFPKAHIIRANGDRKVDGVIPDIVIDKPIIPTAHDVVLEKTLELIQD